MESKYDIAAKHDIAGWAHSAGAKTAVQATACALLSGLLACGSVSAQTASRLQLETRNGRLLLAACQDRHHLKMTIAAMPKQPAAVLLLDADRCAASVPALARELGRPVLAPEVARPAASALFSKGAPAVRQSVVAWGRARLALLSHQAPGMEPALLAAAWKGGASERDVTVWYRPTATMAPPDPMLALAGLEHLYEFLLRQDPEDRYRLRKLDTEPGTGESTNQSAMAHGAVLAAIAGQREHVARALADTPAMRVASWRVADIRETGPAPGKGNRTDIVTVRVNAGGVPVTNAPVTFARPPHMACTATTDAGGVARCRMVDTHGDAGHDEDGDVIASFGGAVAPGLVDLPTTRILRRPGRAAGPEHR